jgi:AcrR family transcriptional regulator
MQNQNKRVDRRVQRTRQLLSSALMSLTIEKGYASVTVQDIIDRANLGRSTFYAHYQDKEDLLLSGIDEVVHTLILGDETTSNDGQGKGIPQRILSTETIFRHAQEEYQLHKAIFVGRGLDVMIKEIQNHLCSHIEEQIEKLLPDRKFPPVKLSVISNYLAGALLTLLVWWLEKNMPYPPDRMDALFQELSMPGVWNVLELSP